MGSDIGIETARLRLRRWRTDDRAAFAALNADPEVMAFFPSVLTRAQTDASLARIAAHFDRYGWGPWAVEIPGVTRFAGFIGLNHVRFSASFTPAVEVGWRLTPAVWGQGYASEGGRAALEFAFAQLGLDEIVAFTTPANIRSRAVMHRIGMIRDTGGDFEHPELPVGHHLKAHVLYRARRPHRSPTA